MTTTASLPNKYQTFFPRVGASIIDAIIFFPIIYFGDKIFDPNPNDSAFWIFLQNVIYYAYSIIGHNRFGKTIGKHFSSIRVVQYQDENKLLSLKQSFLRDIIGITLVVLEILIILLGYSHTTIGQTIIFFSTFLWIAAEIITMLFNQKRRSIHDYIAQSVCISTRRGVATEI